MKIRDYLGGTIFKQFYCVLSKTSTTFLKSTFMVNCELRIPYHLPDVCSPRPTCGDTAE